METLRPITRWADSKSKVFMKIELSDVKDPDITICKSNVFFKGFGSGARGENFYESSFDLFAEIIPERSSYKLSDRCIDFTIMKARNESWPRLLSTKNKPGWLKIDFDKMDIEDSEAEESQAHLNNISFENRAKSDLDRASDEIPMFIKIAYLAIYNAGQGVAFWVIFGKLLFSLLQNGTDAFSTAFDTVGDLFLTCQLCALIEIINPMLRIVKTGVVAPLIQVGGRNFILFVLILPNEETHSSSVVYFLFLAWASIEIVRYPFYVTSIFHWNFRMLTWLRYSLWVALYPAGLICEGLIVFKSIPYAEKTRRLSIELPNTFNMSFSFSWFLRIYILILIFGGSYMMKHLLILRGRKLGHRRRKVASKSD